MTTVLGYLFCGRIGCLRRREVHAEGRVVYKFCATHRAELTRGAFGAA